MSKSTFKISIFLIAALFFIAGCATTRARKPEPTVDSSVQIADLQKQLQAKDQEIRDLQYQLASSQQALSTGNFASKDSKISKADKASFIHVSGVSVTDVQSALVRAGYDPGPVDGHAGKKTKKAVKRFQKKHKLTADGIIGDKTWDLLKNG